MSIDICVLSVHGNSLTVYSPVERTHFYVHIFFPASVVRHVGADSPSAVYGLCRTKTRNLAVGVITLSLVMIIRAIYISLSAVIPI